MIGARGEDEKSLLRRGETVAGERQYDSCQRQGFVNGEHVEETPCSDLRAHERRRWRATPLKGVKRRRGMMAQVDRNRTQFIDLAQMCLSAAEVPLGDFWYASVVVGMPGHFVSSPRASTLTIFMPQS